jgi:diacylglycerol O-acyltransferase
MIGRRRGYTPVSHDETCCIAVNLDPAAVTKPESVARCLTEGFAEVLALSGSDTETDRRLEGS